MAAAPAVPQQQRTKSKPAVNGASTEGSSKKKHRKNKNKKANADKKD